MTGGNNSKFALPRHKSHRGWIWAKLLLVLSSNYDHSEPNDSLKAAGEQVKWAIGIASNACITVEQQQASISLIRFIYISISTYDSVSPFGLTWNLFLGIGKSRQLVRIYAFLSSNIDAWVDKSTELVRGADHCT